MKRQVTVTTPDWTVAVETSSAHLGARLSVFRGFVRGRPRYGDANGRMFETSEHAWSFALAHGYTQLCRVGWCLGCRRQHWFCGSRAGMCAQHGGYAYPGCVEAQVQFDATRRSTVPVRGER